jgi:hypothetical protein
MRKQNQTSINLMTGAANLLRPLKTTQAYAKQKYHEKQNNAKERQGTAGIIISSAGLKGAWGASVSLISHATNYA